MKKLFLLTVLFACACSVSSYAQIIKEKAPIEAKYLAGAVPVNADGIVAFERDITPSQSLKAAEAYDKVLHWIGQYFRREDVLNRRTLNRDSVNNVIKVGINEYVIFKSTALVLDRTQMLFSLEVKCTDKGCHVTMSDISYYYEEERDPQKLQAEEWITDENALNKKKTKLNRLSGKFRVKTIDKFDDICEALSGAL